MSAINKMKDFGAAAVLATTLASSGCAGFIKDTFGPSAEEIATEQKTQALNSKAHAQQQAEKEAAALIRRIEPIVNGRQKLVDFFVPITTDIPCQTISQKVAEVEKGDLEANVSSFTMTNSPGIPNSVVYKSDVSQTIMNFNGPRFSISLSAVASGPKDPILNMSNGLNFNATGNCLPAIQERCTGPTLQCPLKK